MSTEALSGGHGTTWAVDSPAVGSGLTARPCRGGLRASVPPPSPDPIAVTLSGGGFRATLAGLGALRMVADLGRLGDLRYLSSVSGGSITNAVTALAWPELRRCGFTTAAFDDLVVEPIVRKVSGQSLKMALIKGIWRTIGPSTRTDLLARRLDEWFLHGNELEHLDPQVRWIFSAGNLVTGVRFGFERDVVGDYTIGLASTKGSGLRVAVAAATSAAVPGSFAPMKISGVSFPCGTEPPMLVDGGVYDNTGLEALHSDKYAAAFLFSLNAGGLLHAGSYGKVPLIRELIRSNALLYRQSTTLRTRDMVSRFDLGRKALAANPDGPMPKGARNGVLVGLATDFAGEPTARLARWRQTHPELRDYDGIDLALYPTVFDKLDERLCRALVYRGWWLMGAALATYYPERLPDPLPPPPPT